MKKLIAVVLTVAMMLTVCAFSASAAVAPSLVLQGAADVEAGADYTVIIRLNDTDNQVGAFQGELAYTGATFKSVQVNPKVTAYNNGDADETIIKNDGDSVNFVAVADIDGTNDATQIWFKVTFTAAAGASFELKNVIFSDKNGNKIEDATVGAALAPNVVSDPSVTLKKVGILEQTEANKQGIVVNAGLSNIPAEATEYGVVFYPTALLNGEQLTVETVGAVKASVVKETNEATFNKFIEKQEFNAVLHFNFSTETKATQFLGTKVSARVYYIVDGEPVYSANSVDKYIQSGVSSKAVLNTVLDKGDTITDESANKSENVTVAKYSEVKGALNTSDLNWEENRITVLTFAVDNFASK